MIRWLQQATCVHEFELLEDFYIWEEPQNYKPRTHHSKENRQPAQDWFLVGKEYHAFCPLCGLVEKTNTYKK